LRSFWEGRDIDLRRSLDLYPSAEIEGIVREARSQDRKALLEALDGQGLKPGAPASPDDPFTSELAHALHVYLARSSAALAAVQIEDLLGMAEPVNVPGTYREYPNWQRKLSEDLEDMAARRDFDGWFEDLCRARAVSP
jgi:4-alpha-glucanotransferase